MRLRKVFFGTCLAAACIGMIGCGKNDKNSGTSYLKKVNLGTYKKVEVEKVSTEPTEEEIQEKVETYLQTIKSKDKKVDKGETVNIDYVGTINGKEFEGGSYNGYNLKIGSGSFIQGFEEQLIGKTVGKTYKINVTFPKDYTKELAGKKATFEVTINYIAAKQLTDAIVKADDSNDFKTAKEFKENIIGELEDELESRADSTIKTSIINNIVENSKFKNIEGDIEKELKAQIEQIEKNYNITLKKYAQEMGSDEKTVRAQLKSSAESYVKQTIVLLAIAEKEDITLSEKEFESNVQKTLDEYKAAGYEMTKEELYKQVGSKAETKKYFLQRAVQALKESSDCNILQAEGNAPDGLFRQLLPRP